MGGRSIAGEKKKRKEEKYDKNEGRKEGGKGGGKVEGKNRRVWTGTKREIKKAGDKNNIREVWWNKGRRG